jgi:hypothetical protein
MAEMRINPESATARLRSPVHGRAWTKIAKTTPCKVKRTLAPSTLAALRPDRRRKRPQPDLIPLQVARVDEARQAAINRRVEGVSSKAAATGCVSPKRLQIR